jgi:hypothetical protein
MLIFILKTNIFKIKNYAVRFVRGVVIMWEGQAMAGGDGKGTQWSEIACCPCAPYGP